ncbi:MAG: transcription termination/antitermination protein NusA, partial [Bacteroidales bacterium]|nr:transcription termination/antitermination protein NusA [Bacteroidales bacterium]
DVYRNVNEEDQEDDVLLDDFSDEIDSWIIDSIKSIGLDTAKAVLAAPRNMLVEKADLEEDTVDEVLRILNAEFEKE